MKDFTGLCSLNGKDMWTEWGGLLQQGAYEALMTPPGMKDYIENKSRLEHGTQVIATLPRVEERAFSLSIKIRGKDKADYLEKYRLFMQELQGGLLLLRVPALDATFRVLYDSCTKYGNYGLQAGLFSIKFREPNPTLRGDD